MKDEHNKHLLYKLIEDPEYMLLQNILYLAKNYNYFG